MNRPARSHTFRRHDPHPDDAERSGRGTRSSDRSAAEDPALRRAALQARGAAGRRRRLHQHAHRHAQGHEGDARDRARRVRSQDPVCEGRRRGGRVQGDVFARVEERRGEAQGEEARGRRQGHDRRDRLPGDGGHLERRLLHLDRGHGQRPARLLHPPRAELRAALHAGERHPGRQGDQRDPRDRRRALPGRLQRPEGEGRGVLGGRQEPAPGALEAGGRAQPVPDRPGHRAARGGAGERRHSLHALGAAGLEGPGVRRG